MAEQLKRPAEDMGLVLVAGEIKVESVLKLMVAI